MPIILDGKSAASSILDDVKRKVQEADIRPLLVIIMSHESADASKVYVRNKLKCAEQIGITVQVVTAISEKDAYAALHRANTNSAVNGIIIQRPCTFEGKEFEGHVDFDKDVDGWEPNSIFNPCTPEGVIKLLDHYNIPIEGQNCVVLGRSKTVGKPLGDLLLSRNGTVSICHSRSNPLTTRILCQGADIICSAIGKPHFITPSFITPHRPIIIDIGINRDESGKLCGDMDVSCQNLCKGYSPVPGGVGPMTVITLMSHVVDACIYQQHEENY